MAKKEENKTTNRESLSDVLKDSLNSMIKGQKIAYYLDGSEETPTDLTEWVSTGCATLDIAISNRRDGGYPIGRIVELMGDIPRIELFAREKTEGWDVWGNEVESDIAL